MKHTLVRLGLTALVTSVLFGCGGGSDGAAGTNSVVTINQAGKESIASNATTTSSASVLAWQALQPVVTVTGVTVNSPPVVSFAVTDAAGKAVVGLGNTSQGANDTVKSLTNLRFSIAKLVPGNGVTPDKWVSYLVVRPFTTAEAAGTIAATESCKTDATLSNWCGNNSFYEKEGTLVDNGDGTYKYTFSRDITKVATIVAGLPDSVDGLKKKADLGDLSYNPALTHRVGIEISGAAPGTGSNTPTATTVVPGVNMAIPTNATYDFRPDGQAVASTRNIVDKTSCDSCHNGKGIVHGATKSNPAYCSTCHTDQLRYGKVEATIDNVTNGVVTLSGSTYMLDGRSLLDFPNLIHKAHMAGELSVQNYSIGTRVKLTPNKGDWIQDPRNCTKCHSGQDKTDANQATKTKDGDNWLNKPNRLACAACHDNVSFASTIPAGFVAHTGGAAGDDSTCASCHSASGQAGSVAVSHSAEFPTPNNLTQIDGIASISYEIKSVVVDASTGQPSITFRIMKGGDPVLEFNTPTLVSGKVPDSFELIQGFIQAKDPDSGRTYGPTFYVAYGLPQDGITDPQDFSGYQSASLATVLVAASGSAKTGTLTGPTTDGTWTVTLTGTATSPVKIPATAKMVTGAIIGNFAQTVFTAGTKAADKFPSGVIIKTPLVQKVATGYTGRRVIVDNNKCEACHEQLGSAVSFHGGARNDATACAICHNVNQTSGGWSANASTFVHAIHAGTSKTTADLINGTLTVPCISGTNCVADVGVPGNGLGGAGPTYSSGKRYIPFSWKRGGTATAPTWNAAAIAYPGILKRCDNCHVPNAVNFGANGATLLPKLLWTTSAATASSGNTTLNYSSDTAKILPRDPVTGKPAHANLLAGGSAYGSTFKLTASTGLMTEASGTTLVESPVSAACFACHDTSTARAHMTQYGGVIYGTRVASTVSGALVNNETCLICHGMGRDQDAAVVHSK